MDISISKTADGRNRKFIGGQWFPLSKDDRTAKLQTMALMTQWEQLKDTGVRAWPETVLADKQTFVISLVSMASVASPAPMLTMPPAAPTAVIPATASAPIPTAPFNPNPASPYDTLTLYEGIDQFLRHIKARYESNEIGDDHYYHQIFHVIALKECIGDQPLAFFGRDQLTQIKRHFASRPISGKTGKPISIEFLTNILQTSHMIFDWLERTDRWLAPRHWKTYLLLERHERQRLLTPEERKVKRHPKPTFTMDELKILWKFATPGTRMFLLMGINFGWTQKEIATLRHDDIVERNGEMYIEKFRNKTSVEGRWWVFPELAAMIRERIKLTPENPEKLAFLGANGLPLLHRSRNGRRTDAVSLCWTRVTNQAKKCGVRSFGFSRLRKTGAQMVRNLSDLSLARVFLSHAGATVAENHYVSNDGNPEIGMTEFQKLEKVLRQIHIHLQATIGATAPANTGAEGLQNQAA